MAALTKAPSVGPSDVKEILKNVTPKLFIDGQFRDSVSKKTFPVVDPRTEEVIIEVAEADKPDIDLAVAAARKAFDEGPWPKLSGKERGKLLFKFADKIIEHKEELAALEALNVGKPLMVSSFLDVPYTADHLRYYAGWADKIHGKVVPVNGPFMAYTLHEPIGVCGQILPWNFPMVMASWKLGPALACGNTVVLKPAEQTPLTTLRLAELAVEAGIPPGVINVVPGYGPTAGAALVEHPGVDKIAFTGSVEVGKLVGAAAAMNIKPCTLELGGKSPIIVCPGVDVEWAVAEAHSALFFNGGQACTAGSRVYVHESIYDEFVAKAVEVAQSRRVGDPFTNVDQGPQVDADQFNKILHYIELGRSQGARLATGGRRMGDKGYYVEPTVFADVSDDMAIAQEEIFGPVQSIMKWSTVEEVVKRANATPFGLAAAVFSKDIDTCNTISRALKAGTVWVNCYNLADNAVPFGGYKQSGVGREKGEYALHNYTQVKSVYMPLKDPAWL